MNKEKFDQAVSNANRAGAKPGPEKETSFLPIILFLVLTLAGVLAALALIVAKAG